MTSNTVQFGAKVELKAGASIFNVYGFLFARRADPVRPVPVIVEIAGMLAVRTGSSVLFAVRLQLMLSGPSPWHAKGKALVRDRLHLHHHHQVKFEVTVGDRDAAAAADRVIDLLAGALPMTAWRVLPASTRPR